jgi:hypothetical protein
LTAAWEHNGVWTLGFTQEWPVFSQTHQFSYTVPYIFERNEDGVGDVLLNYRWQALMESESLPAFAPRFSLVLPTGDNGLTDDTVGYQFNLPVSKILADRWTAHFNAGMTLLPDAADGDLEHFNLGASAIYAFTPTFNAMLECVSNWDEDARGRRPAAVIVSPGVHYALNLADTQLVLGVAVPVGLTSAAPDYGVFLYVSFEHIFHKDRSQD